MSRRLSATQLLNSLHLTLVVCAVFLLPGKVASART